jgi:hypothetical protein
LGKGGGGGRRLGWSGAIRARIERDDLVYGEYAVPEVTAVRLRDKDGEGANGEPGKELTRRISSDMGVDFDQRDDTSVRDVAEGVAPLG